MIGRKNHCWLPIVTFLKKEDIWKHRPEFFMEDNYMTVGSFCNTISHKTPMRSESKRSHWDMLLPEPRVLRRTATPTTWDKEMVPKVWRHGDTAKSYGNWFVYPGDKGCDNHFCYCHVAFHRIGKKVVKWWLRNISGLPLWSSSHTIAILFRKYMEIIKMTNRILIYFWVRMIEFLRRLSNKQYKITHLYLHPQGETLKINQRLGRGS